MINMNFWHKAESLHLRISKLGFGMDVYIYIQIRQKGTIISAWWRLLGGGRITIPILYMGVDIHVNDFSAGFSKDVSGKV